MVNVLLALIVTKAIAWNCGGVTPGGPCAKSSDGIEVQREHGATTSDGADADEGAA